MAGYGLGLCGRPSLRDHHISEESSWMVLPPYPQYPTPATSHAIATSAMAGGLVGVTSVGHPHSHPHAGVAHHHGPVTDYSALASSLQQRRSPLTSAAYTHSCILEMRKEKSRDAARSRRGKENYEFYELAKMLPLPAAITSQLDKASIIRLTISYLKLKDFSSNGDPPWIKENPNKALKGGSRARASAAHNGTVELFDQHQGTHILQSLDGFAFSLGSDGRFLYISETVSIYLGLSQVEMTGSSIFDYVHTGDHGELAEQLGLTLANPSQGQGQSSSGQGLNHHLHSPPSPASGTGSVDDGNSSMNPDVTSLMSLESNAAYKGLDRSFCIRMKSTLTKRGCHFKSSGYRVVMVLCRLRPQSQFSSNKANPQQQPSQQLQTAASQPLLGMIALAIALPPPTVHEVRLEPDMFVTRLSFDLRIIHCEPRISDLLDFAAEDLNGRSLYTLCHAEDIRLLRKAHTDLMHKGQVMTPYYRVMNRHGGFTWLQSCATVVCNSKNGDEQSIVCVNYVLSRTEMSNLILDQCQLESAPPNPIKSGAFKTDASLVTQREFPVSPEGTSSESGSDPRSANQGGPASDSSALDNRPSPELEVEDSSAPGSQLAPPPPPEDSGAGIRSARHSRGSSRSAKRKYQESSTPSAEINGIVNLDAVGAVNSNPVGDGGGQDSSMAHGESEAEADAARWKRLYTGSGLEHDGLQERDLEANNMSASTTDFSTDALLSKPRSTIQWIGTPTSSSASALSVPSLMRQIFASRESVIRANVHANRTSAGVFNGTGNDNLPTPPGSGAPSDYASAVHDSVFPPTSSYSASSGFAEYLPAMTPPSSVSPRDAAGALFTSEASLRYPYALADSSYVSPAQPLPLKPPHVYGVHGIDHSTSAAQYGAQPPLPLTDAGQFYPHGASGFHLYHPQITKSTSSNNSAASWYPN